MRERPRELQRLREGYTPSVRVLEIAGIVGFAAVMVALGTRLTPHLLRSPWLAVLAVVGGYFAADFISGVVHWMADTWGSPSSPFFGKAFIRPFREHHLDPEAICRHDFVETNGNNCLISIPSGVVALFIPVGPDQPLGLLLASGIGSLLMWVMATNQFHKWAHEREPARFVRLLQRLHVVLPAEHHRVHHTVPFQNHYCITSGWMNGPLRALGFFRRLERLVTWTTGALPRAPFKLREHHHGT